MRAGVFEISIPSFFTRFLRFEPDSPSLKRLNLSVTTSETFGSSVLAILSPAEIGLPFAAGVRPLWQSI